MMQLVKIGLYARVSSEKQAQEKTIDSQIDSILEYAATSGEKIDPDLRFIDDGVSGACLERPGLDQLRDKALSGNVTKVYVLSPDRLSRKSAHQILLIEEMKRLGVSFSFVNRQIGDTPEDQMLLQIQGIVAEYEREKLIERARRGKLYAAKQGKINVLSAAPYGYYYKKSTETEDAQYLIHPEEAAIVKEVFSLYCEKNFSIGKITRHCITQGYLTRTGKAFWCKSVIWGILNNTASKGMAAFRKTKRVPRSKKTKSTLESKKLHKYEFSSLRSRPQEEWIYIPVPAIIDEKLFELAQRKLKDNVKFSLRNNKKYEYLLSGLLRCKSCGYSIYGKPTSHGGYVHLYYRCMGQDGYRWPNGKLCSGHPVRTEVLDELAWDSVKKLLLNPTTIVEEYNRRLTSVKMDHDVILMDKKNERNRYHKERDRLIDLFQNGLVEKSEIEVKLKGVRSKIERVNNEIDYFLKQRQESQKLLMIISNLDDFTKNLNKNLDSHTFDEKKNIVRFLIEQVEVDSINEEINVKHIIPINEQKYPLRSGSHF